MWLNEKFQIKYPIIQGGMAHIATGQFASSVSNSGALGLVASGGLSPEELRFQIREAKKQTNKPFGVNLMLMHPQIEELVDIVCEEEVAVVTTGAGNPGAFIQKFKDHHICVMPVVASVALAKRMERLDVDALIVEGCEAGGHIGELTTMAIVPQIKESTNLPVIVAGGLATGRQLLAAEMLGADGFQAGTIFLSSIECPIHHNYKEAIIKAKDSDTTVTGRIGGTPVRLLKNQMTRAYIKKEKEGASLEELEVYTLGSLSKAVKDGDIKNGSLMAGQVAGLIHEIKPVHTILQNLFEEYNTLKKGYVSQWLK